MPQNKKTTTIFIDTEIIEHVKLNTKIKNLSENITWMKRKEKSQTRLMLGSIKKKENTSIR